MVSLYLTVDINHGDDSIAQAMDEDLLLFESVLLNFATLNKGER